MATPNQTTLTRSCPSGMVQTVAKEVTLPPPYTQADGCHRALPLLIGTLSPHNNWKIHFQEVNSLTFYNINAVS